MKEQCPTCYWRVQHGKVFLCRCPQLLGSGKIVFMGHCEYYMPTEIGAVLEEETER